MDILGFLGDAVGFLQEQGLLGDALKWTGGLLASLPFVGPVFGGIVGIFNKSAAYKIGETWGLWVSQTMRKVPVFGKYWELIEDQLLGGAVEVMRGIKSGADDDDDQPVGLP
jgi:hypothetical protein